MKRQRVDVVAESHPPRARDGRGDHEVRAGQEGIIGEVVLGEPALAESQRLGQGDLVQHLVIRLVVRDAAALAVVEESEVHGSAAIIAGLRSGSALRGLASRSTIAGVNPSMPGGTAGGKESD